MFFDMSNIFGPFWVVAKSTKKIQSLSSEHGLSLAEIIMEATLPEPCFSTWVILASLTGIEYTFLTKKTP